MGWYRAFSPPQFVCLFDARAQLLLWLLLLLLLLLVLLLFFAPEIGRR